MFASVLLLALAATEPAAPALDAATAGRFAELALACVHKEYPNKLAHVLGGDQDVKPPRELTPALKASRSGNDLNQLDRADAVEWRPLKEPGVTGVWVKTLRLDPATRRAPTILLRFEAGASYPAHTHSGGEELFVLEGDIRLDPDRLQAGDYLYTAPDNAHAVFSEKGCVILVQAPQAVRILNAEA